jgi:hypothetical protein
LKIQINDTNYSYYKKVYETIASHVLKLYPPEILKDANPIDILNSWELKSKTIAKRGLKAGLQDFISQIKEFTPDLRNSIDQDLTANNLPNLNELEDTVNKIVSRVLKRQKIKSPEEFYIVKEEVIKLNSNLSDGDRTVLDKCLGDFEIFTKRNNGT